MSVIDQPLLDEAALLDLFERAHAPSIPYPHRLLEQFQLGDVASRFRGGGLDYEDSRLYEVGDEPRFFNWRLTARTGRAHIKQFREERRPGVFILLDRRLSMRFGTRTRLKITQASRAAALIAFAALHQGWSVAGVQIQTTAEWFPASQDHNSIWHFVRRGASPAPASQHHGEQQLSTLLPHINAHMIKGTHLYLISDFADNDQDYTTHILEMAAHHPLFAIHVMDDAERALPDAGFVELQGMSHRKHDEVRTLNLSDKTLQQQYAAHAAQRQHTIEQQIRHNGGDYYPILARHETLETRIPLPHGLGQ